MKIIKDRRNELGVSQKQLAIKCKVHQTQISRLELKKRKPSLRIIIKLSNYLHLCSVSIFIDATGCCNGCDLNCPFSPNKN